MDRAKFQETVRKLARHFNPKQRQKVNLVGRVVWKAIAFFTLLSGLISFVINGTDLFTKKIPSANASISKYVLLAKTGRPYLLRQLIEKDLALPGMCPGKVLVSDFDGDGQATDLVIELLARDEEGSCTQDPPKSTAYALMKDSPSSNFWPKYTLLRLITRDDQGTFAQGTGYPLTFQQMGKFLVGSIYGTDFPGWILYGYSNGEMHEFGRYRPLGSLSEVEGSEPISEIGDKLFIPTEAGILSLEITANGQFKKRFGASPQKCRERPRVREAGGPVFGGQAGGHQRVSDDDTIKDVQVYSTEELKTVANASFNAAVIA